MDVKKIRMVLIITAIIFIILISIIIVYSTAKSAPEVGLSFVPTPDDSSTLIYYKSHDNGAVNKLTASIDKFLEPYRKGSISSEGHSGAENLMICDYNAGPVGEKQVCDVPVHEFHPCTSANQYNYPRSGPCVFLKLNNVLDWKPEPYNNTSGLPEAMPEDLKMHISMVSGKPEANTFWVTCEGESPADREFIGPIQYIPRRGFPSYYFPFTNKEGYLSPLVAVLFERPKYGVLINVECKLWAKNITSDSPERRASVHFELMID